MYKASKNYARIAEPKTTVMELPKFDFHLDEDSKIFGITKKDGIVYVKDAIILKQFNQPNIT